jgi:hypothetical protein
MYFDRTKAAMKNRKVRNEFGLDEYNALDVQKERLNRAMPVILGAVAFLAVAAFVVIPAGRSRNNFSLIKGWGLLFCYLVWRSYLSAERVCRKDAGVFCAPAMVQRRGARTHARQIRQPMTFACTA